MTTRGMVATLLASLSVVSAETYIASAQTQGDSAKYFYEYEPWPLPVTSSIFTAGVTVIILPSLLVED